MQMAGSNPGHLFCDMATPPNGVTLAKARTHYPKPSLLQQAAN